MYDEYNTIDNHQWIPKQAFLYFPEGDSSKKQEDDFKIIYRDQIKRLIYEGDIEYVQEENQKIDQFKKFIQKKGITLGKQWSKAYLYKFLQSAGYDQKKAIKQILSHNQYKKNLHNKNFDDLRKTAQPYLKKGLLYFNGRDAKFRPILVCDIAKIHAMKLTEDQLYLCFQYFFQFLYRNMLINGQVQNLIGIIDVGGTSPMDLIKPMKMTIGFLQGNYKYKLHATYIIQSTGMFQMAYKIAKQFMKQDTIRKINIIENGHSIDPLLAYANPKQLEVRFGGQHQNLKQNEFWPPQFFSDDYSHPLVKTKIVSENEYKQMYEEGKLPARKIYLDFIRQGSDSSYSQPILNNKNPSLNNIADNDPNQVNKKQRNFIERALNKVFCHGCFGNKEHIQKRKSRRKRKH